MQKAHELICWWHVGNRVARRHSLAAELNEPFVDEAEAPTADELNFLRSKGFMVRKQATDPDESTYMVAGKAPDEVVSSWSVNPRVCMPSTVHTHNELLVVAKPLSKSELRQRDVLLSTGPARIVPRSPRRTSSPERDRWGKPPR